MVKKLFPMPVEALFRHERYVSLPAAARGMLLSLLEFYWLNGCRVKPRSDDELFQLARAHRSTWKAWKGEIITIFDAVTPELARYHTERSNRTQAMRILGREGRAHQTAIAAKARLDALERAIDPPQSFHQLGIVPKREPPSQRPAPPDQRPPRALRVDKLPNR